MTSVTFLRRGEKGKPIFQDRQEITLSKGRENEGIEDTFK